MARRFVRILETDLRAGAGASADLRSDPLLQCAFRRRSIAFEMADLASYESMELVTDLFLRELMRAPPPGFSKVTLDQLLRPDRELFFELGHRCRTGVRRMPGGRRPFDVQIPLILDSPQFRYFLSSDAPSWSVFEAPVPERQWGS